MFAIEATNSGNRRWISGIFAERSDAEAFLQSIPEPARTSQWLVEVPWAAYPVFIAEEDGFEYGDVHFIREKLRGLVPRGDENYVHLNVYAVREDFCPRLPGTDMMGLLMHWHLTDRSLMPENLAAFDQELERVANGGPIGRQNL